MEMICLEIFVLEFAFGFGGLMFPGLGFGFGLVLVLNIWVEEGKEGGGRRLGEEGI